MTTELKSNCCSAPTKVTGMSDFAEVGDDETCTVHYECEKCGNGCDVEGRLKIGDRVAYDRSLLYLETPKIIAKIVDVKNDNIGIRFFQIQFEENIKEKRWVRPYYLEKLPEVPNE